MAKKINFYERMKTTTIEREVENIYEEGISFYFAVNPSYPFGCDGMIETKCDNGKMLKMLAEYKYDENFRLASVRAKVLVQVLFYLKRFEQNGLILPNVTLVGDKNECFVLHTNTLMPYLDEEGIDWSISPSHSFMSHPELMMKIAEDENINPFVYEIGEGFDFGEVAEKIKSLAMNVQRYVHVTEHNISKIFDYFKSRLIKDVKKISANDLVAIFMGVITNNEDYYMHPSKKDVLVAKGKEISVYSNEYKSFVKYFHRNYTCQERNKFTEIYDRLIDDVERRNDGQFFTPVLFVDKAHDMACELLGDDWKEKYVVWDNCAGTKNLTRDYYFNRLYVSTLEQAELDASEKYNKEAVATFTYDFLNQDLEDLPAELLADLKADRPFVFFLNPPYVTSANFGESSKKGVAETLMNEEMKAKNLGACCQNLYAQFLYRICEIKKKFNLTNVKMILYCPTLFLTGSSWAKFRNYFFNNFEMLDGVEFKASHFADVADSWGIGLTIWDGICE